MKKLLLILMPILITASLNYAVDFGFGPAGLIKKKVEKLDKKVRERRLFLQAQQDSIEEEEEEHNTSDKIDVTFNVTIPSGDAVDLVVTSFQKDLSRHSMSSTGNLTHSATLTLTQNTLLNYYYDIEGGSTKEVLINSNIPLHFRYFHVSTNTVYDTVANWSDSSHTPTTGVLTGTITGGGTPLMDATVSVNGIHAATYHDGTYLIENIPVGNQRITVTTTLGDYKTASKQITVTAGTNSNDFNLDAAQKVTVTFNVTPPNNFPANDVIRIVGNHYKLGATRWYYNTLDAGFSDRYVFMSNSGADFTAAVDLYEGTHIQYSYTMGRRDSGCELDPGDGNPLVRELVVGDTNMTVNDQINSFYVNGAVEVRFNVTVPDNTPVNEKVFLFTGVGVQMNKVSNNNWELTQYLYPGAGTYEYAYSHGISWSSGYEQFTPDDTSARRSITPSASTTISDTVTQWRWFPAGSYPPGYSFTPVEVSTRTEFYGVVSLADFWFPEFLTALESTLEYHEDEGIEYTHVQISQIRNYIDNDTPKMQNRSLVGNVGTVAIQLEDLKKAVDMVHAKGKKVILSPLDNPEMVPGYDNIAFSNHSNSWYDNYMDELEELYMYAALVAEEKDIDMISIIDVRGFQYEDISYKPVINSYLKNLIQKIRAKYSGKVICMEKGFDVTAGYDFYADLDYICDSIWQGFDVSYTPTVSEIQAEVETYLDGNLLTAATTYNKPVILMLAYSAGDGTAKDNNGWVSSSNDDGSVTLDLEEQAQIIEAYCRAIAERDWIVGITNFGYDMIDTPYGKDTSVRAKPAEQVLKSYYSLFYASTGTPKVPIITNVQAAYVYSSSAAITWTTDELASSQVEYGTSTFYGSTAGYGTNSGFNHSETLTHLLAHTTYHFRARSSDADSNLTLSQDYTLVTNDGLNPPAALGFTYSDPASVTVKVVIPAKAGIQKTRISLETGFQPSLE